MLKVTTAEMGGLRTTLIGDEDRARSIVVLLHGYSMTSADLTPFGASLGLDALFAFPDGPLMAEPSGRAWWPRDSARRADESTTGSRDMSTWYPPGRDAARARLTSLLTALRSRFGPRPVVLGGFSQGGMLACDSVLMDGTAVAALVMMSTSRIAAHEWASRSHRLRGLPVFLSHGRLDLDLSFLAGEALLSFLTQAGAQVHWVPFDQGHEIPLVVWRQLRRFLRSNIGVDHSPAEASRTTPGNDIKLTRERL